MNRKYITYLSCTVLAVYAMVLTAISPLIPKIADSFRLDIATVGILFTFTFIGLTVFVPIGGYIADRVGKKKVLNVSVPGVALALVGFVTAPNFVVLCLASIFLGGFGGVTESMIGAFILDINTEKPDYYVNMSQVFFGIGAIIGPLAVGRAISVGLDWRACYVLLGILTAAVALVFLFSKHIDKSSDCAISGCQEESESQKGIPLKLSDLVKSKAFILLCFAMFLYTGSEVGAWGWMCTYLEESFLFSPDQSAMAVALFWLALTIGRIFCGLLTSRFSTVRIIMVLAFSSAVFTLLSAFVKSDAGIYATIVAMGFAFSSQYPLILSYAGKITGKSSGMVFSLLTACSGLGNMVIPYIMGLIGNSFRMSTAMIFPALLFALTGVIFVYFYKKPNEAL